MKKITKNKVTKKPVKVKAKKKVFGDYSFNELNAMKEGEAQKLYNIQEFGKVMYSGYTEEERHNMPVAIVNKLYDEEEKAKKLMSKKDIEELGEVFEDFGGEEEEEPISNLKLVGVIMNEEMMVFEHQETKKLYTLTKGLGGSSLVELKVNLFE